MGNILVEFDVWHPRNPKHGDYTTNLALKLAEATGADPMDIANEIVRQLEKMQRCNTETK